MGTASQKIITVHISPSDQTASIEHLPGEQTLQLTPEQALSVYYRLHEHVSELQYLVEMRQGKKRYRTSE